MRPSILHGSVGSTLGFITCTLCGLKLQGPQKKTTVISSFACQYCPLPRTRICFLGFFYCISIPFHAFYVDHRLLFSTYSELCPRHRYYILGEKNSEKQLQIMDIALIFNCILTFSFLLIDLKK
jgi:hypothetical protein